MERVLVVGGDFSTGEPSAVVDIMGKWLEERKWVATVRNGGTPEDLGHCKDIAWKYGIIFWFPGGDFTDIKKLVPHAMAVTMVRNEEGEIPFQELVETAIARKSNLVFEFQAGSIRVIDPLGCVWGERCGIAKAMECAMKRLVFLKQITRRRTIRADLPGSLPLKWYFDPVSAEMSPDDGIKKECEADGRFLELVNRYAEDFRRFIPAKIQKGNTVGRCGMGMPSFKAGEFLYVSKRIVEGPFLTKEDFLPVREMRGSVFHAKDGDAKPSVDTPVQLRLYGALPAVRFAIHSHCYLSNAPFTKGCYPCGAVEEADAVLDVIDRVYQSRGRSFYAINLNGHGSIALGADLEDLEHLAYGPRPMPEVMEP